MNQGPNEQAHNDECSHRSPEKHPFRRRSWRRLRHDAWRPKAVVRWHRSAGLRAAAGAPFRVNRERLCFGTSGAGTADSTIVGATTLRAALPRPTSVERGAKEPKGHRHDAVAGAFGVLRFEMVAVSVPSCSSSATTTVTLSWPPRSFARFDECEHVAIELVRFGADRTRTISSSVTRSVRPSEQSRKRSSQRDP